MARHCAQWRAGKNGKGKRCRFGRVKHGRRKGKCREHPVGHRKGPWAKGKRYIFHGV